MENLKKEFQQKSFYLYHSRREAFYLCQWQHSTQVSIWYLLYKLLIVFIFLFSLIYGIIVEHSDSGNAFKFFIYITNWGFILCTLQAFLSLRILIQQYLSERVENSVYDNGDLPTVYKIYWALHTVSVEAAIGITVSYWYFLHNPETHPLDFVNIMFHAGNSVLMLTDFFLVSHPVRLCHFHSPMTFSISYSLFNVVYYLLGGTGKLGRTYIYPFLNWNKPKSATIFVIVEICLISYIHFLAWLLYILRRFIAKACITREDIQTNSPTADFY